MDYIELVSVYSKLEGTSKRLEKTAILSDFLKRVDDEQVVLLLQGRVFPLWDERVLGMASKLVEKAILRASGCSESELERVWRETGDLGLSAERLMSGKRQSTLFSQTVTVDKVFANLRKIAQLEGSGTVDVKIALVSELLSSASGVEAKYIVRSVVGDLRIGLGDGTFRDAIVWAFFADKAKMKYDVVKNELVLDDRTSYVSVVDVVQEAIDVANDFGRVVLVSRAGDLSALSSISLSVGTPVKAMLFQKAKNVSDALSVVGSPAAFEFKYDGFRLQIHKVNGFVSLFTRKLENVTKQFPDVVSAVLDGVVGDSFIIDAEVVGVDSVSKKYVAFQTISQRIKRKYDIEQMAIKFPVEVCVFDVLFVDGRSLLKEPLRARRSILESIIKSSKVVLARQVVTDSVDVGSSFYQESLSAGNEGVMVKNLDGPYKPGSRVGFGVKVKPVMDTLEVVVVGAQWGEGKRGKWLASFIVGVRDVNDEIVEIGRVGTGIKEKTEGVTFDQLTELLRPLIISEDSRIVRVKPEIVIEVDYEEIQSSPTYSSGFALRFPRLFRLREDRSRLDINTVDDVRDLFESQRGRGVVDESDENEESDEK